MSTCGCGALVVDQWCPSGAYNITSFSESDTTTTITTTTTPSSAVIVLVNTSQAARLDWAADGEEVVVTNLSPEK